MNKEENTLWYELEEYAEDAEEIPVVNEYDITVSPNDFNIATLFSLMDNGIIKLPAFQRNYVWDEKAASKLIESIILGLPIPQIFLYEKEKNNFLIIDGQQRLLSIYFFIKQRFPNKEGRVQLRSYLMGAEKIGENFLSDDDFFKNFSLKLPSPIPSETNKLNKLKFETLGEYKHSFEYLRTIRAVVIRQNLPEDDDSSMFEIFNRLNTGGQKLKPQEIRMSLYYSHFYKMLFKINEISEWRKILGQNTIDLNFKDIEILLRSFAMLYLHEQYKPTMVKFLNDFSKKSGNFNDEDINYLEKLFVSFLKSSENLSKQDFLTLNNKFNISLFESVFVATCYPFFKAKKLVNKLISPESLITLKNDSSFIEASQSSVGSKTNVTTRMKLAKNLVKLK